MNRVIFIVFCCIFLLGFNVLETLSIESKLFYSILLAISIPIGLCNLKIIKKEPYLLPLLVFVIAISLYKLCTDRTEGTRAIALVLIAAPIFWSTLKPLSFDEGSKNNKLWRKMATLVFVTFLWVVIMALVERVLGHSVFRHVSTFEGVVEGDYSGYRSWSIHGHPLQNALMTTTMMAFILISPLKKKYKYTLWIAGFLAIGCFNTRSSLVGNAALFAAYLIYYVMFNRRTSVKSKVQSILIAVVAVVGVWQLMLVSGLGGRLLNMGLFDEGSAQVRVDTWTLFDFYSLKDFLWGIEWDSKEIVFAHAGLWTTENFYIDFMLRFGLVFLAVYAFLVVMFVKGLYKGYDIFTCMFTSAAFILIASTNNSLSSTFVPLLLFFVCIHVFNPQNVYSLIPRRYLVEEK